MTAASAQASTALRLRDVRFAWPRAHADVIDIAAFEVQRGEHLFLEGPSGSGKSTLLGLLGGVHVPRTGAVEVLGTDLAGLRGPERDRFRADHIGFVFQMFNLVPYLSVLENVALPTRFSARRKARTEQGGGERATAMRLLEALDLDAAAIGTRSVAELSIGQQQRVAVARALIGAPELVVADEPTSALDEGTRDRFMELLFAECARADATLVFVSHDARLGAHFTRRESLGRTSGRFDAPRGEALDMPA